MWLPRYRVFALLWVVASNVAGLFAQVYHIWHQWCRVFDMPRFCCPAGQEREQTSGRASEVVDTKERIVEVTQPDPCGGTPTGAGGATGVGYGSTGTGTGAGYGTGSGAGRSSGRGQEYDASGGQVDDRTMMQKGVDAVKPGSQVGQHSQNR